MARLDRMGSAKEIAQMGAMLGREFSYEVLHAVSPLQDAALQQALAQLVEAEVLYQRGMLPRPIISSNMRLSRMLPISPYSRARGSNITDR